MVRKLIIRAVLVPESLNKQPEEIEREIFKEIHQGLLVIPWCNKVEKIRVIDK
ncbi:MAG: hypothetical protein ACUVTB_05325 [Candidatus Bathycorpusculaceae bacterium]